jgi:viroplasmin and RNaseH domain-containing protein
MAWYVVDVGHVPGIYRTWEDCYAQVNLYLGNLNKKYNIEAEALRAYYSHPAYLGNHGPTTYYGPMNAKPCPSTGTGD